MARAGPLPGPRIGKIDTNRTPSACGFLLIDDGDSARRRSRNDGPERGQKRRKTGGQSALKRPETGGRHALAGDMG